MKTTRRGRDAEDRGGLGVAADRVELAPEAGPAEDDRSDDHDDDRDDARRSGCPRMSSWAASVKPGGRPASGTWWLPGDEVVDAAEDAQRAERRDDRRDPQDRDDEPVDHAQEQADADPEQDRAGRTEQLLLERAGDAVGDQPHHRLDREVDVPGDDDERLADRGHGHDRGEDGDLREVVDGQELGRRDRDEGAQDEHDRDEAELALAGDHAEPGAAVARDGQGRGRAGLRHRRCPPVGSGVIVGRRRHVPGRGEHDPLLGRPVVRDLGRDPTLVEDEDPVGHRDDLGQVARDEDDPEAGRGQLRDDPVDLDLGPDVDAAGRLVEDQQPRLRGQPLGEDDLLLVAARQCADHLLDAVIFTLNCSV